MEHLQEYVKQQDLDYNLCYSDGKHIYEQIYPYIGKNKIILAHGAGMFCILFMEDKSQVIEIIPKFKLDEDNGAAQGIKRICGIKNNKLKRLVKRNGMSVKNMNSNEFLFDIN